MKKLEILHERLTDYLEEKWWGIPVLGILSFSGLIGMIVFYFATTWSIGYGIAWVFDMPFLNSPKWDEMETGGACIALGNGFFALGVLLYDYVLSSNARNKLDIWWNKKK